MTHKNSKKGRGMSRIMIFSALFAALIFLATAYLPRIPTALGYVHLGDGFVLLAAAWLPLPYAIAAAAVGGGLADLLTGYAIWLPATVVIKALMALCISSRKNALSVRNIVGMVLATLINAGGYYIFQAAFISQSFIVPLVDIPFNIIQTLVGGVIFLILGTIFDRTPSLKDMLPVSKEKDNNERNKTE